MHDMEIAIMDINTNLNNKKIIDTINCNGKFVNVETIRKKALTAVAMLVAMASALVIIFL